MRLRLPTVCLSTVCLLPLAAFLACGQTDGPLPTSSEGKEEACAETCALLAECDDSLDVAECTESCTEEEGISRGAQEAMLECIEELGCAEMQSAAMVACLLSGVGDIPPSATGEAFCEESLPRLGECLDETGSDAGSGDVPEEFLDADSCLLTVSAGSDELLAELNDCLEADKSCQSARLCVGLELAPYVLAAQNPTPGSLDFTQLLGSLLGSTGLPGQPSGEDGSAPPLDPDGDDGPEPPFGVGGATGER